jgi:hypothetical protein
MRSSAGDGGTSLFKSCQGRWMGRIKNQRHQQLHNPRKHKFFRAWHVKAYDYHLVWELLLFGAASAFCVAASGGPFALPAQAQEGRNRRGEVMN